MHHAGVAAKVVDEDAAGTTTTMQGKATAMHLTIPGCGKATNPMATMMRRHRRIRKEAKNTEVSLF